jgi:hypothetical protein
VPNKPNLWGFRKLASKPWPNFRAVGENPLEQQQVIAPIRQQAASDLNRAFQEATDNGVKFDVGKSAFEEFQKIKGPAQQKAIGAFNELAQEVGITNRRQATPLEARELRQALSLWSALRPRW